MKDILSAIVLATRQDNVCGTIVHEVKCGAIVQEIECAAGCPTLLTIWAHCATE